MAICWWLFFITADLVLNLTVVSFCFQHLSHSQLRIGYSSNAELSLTIILHLKYIKSVKLPPTSLKRPLSTGLSWIFIFVGLWVMTRVKYLPNYLPTLETQRSFQQKDIVLKIWNITYQIPTYKISKKLMIFVHLCSHPAIPTFKTSIFNLLL